MHGFPRIGRNDIFLGKRGEGNLGSCRKYCFERLKRYREKSYAHRVYGASAVLTIATALRKFLDDVSKLRAAFVAGARGLAFAAATTGLTARRRLPATDSAVGAFGSSHEI